MATSTHAIRVGLIGYGFSGKTFHAPLIRAVPGLALKAVASRDREKVHTDLPGVTVYDDPIALARSDDIDLVVVATPNSSHATLAQVALAAGKHVVVDKPFTLDLAEARGLLAMSREKGLMLSVFHNRRWDSDFLTIRRAIAEGMVGTVIHFESHMDRFRPLVRNRWRENGDPGSGIWFDLGPHLVDQALQLFGLPDRVHANLSHQRTGSQADDWAHVVLDYGERRAILHASLLVAGGTHRFTVHGTAGSAVKKQADRQEQQLMEGMLPGAPGWGEDTDGLVVYDPTGGQQAVDAAPGDQRKFYAGLVESFKGATPDAVTAIQSLAVMAVIEAGFESSRAQRAVGLPLTEKERAAWP